MSDTQSSPVRSLARRRLGVLGAQLQLLEARAAIADKQIRRRHETRGKILLGVGLIRLVRRDVPGAREVYEAALAELAPRDAAVVDRVDLLSGTSDHGC